MKIRDIEYFQRKRKSFIKDLGYAAVGATLSTFAPKYYRRLKISAIVKKMAYRRLQQAEDLEQCKIKGSILLDIERINTICRTRCNHKKGGTLGHLVPKAWYHNGWQDKSTPNGLSRWEGQWEGTNTYITGQGDSIQYAVTKHQFANGDIHVRCMRCGKNWKPGDYEYVKALEFDTHNVTSTSIQFGFGTPTYDSQTKEVREESDREQAFQKRYKDSLGNGF